ncbi:hypothetical protein MBLNU13_g08523t1 [Cladosporium sp. NU13]
MSARAFTLPIRAFSRPQVAQQAERYTCRRCLHTTQTQAQEATSVQIEAEAPILPVPVSEPKTAAKYNPTLNATQRDYPLSTKDRLVKRILPHSIRPQLLQHVNPAVLHGREREAALKAEKHKEIVGVVVRTGSMNKTYFADHTNHLVHDPNNSLNQGDVISLHRLKVSTAVHHVVASIITPFGTPIKSRRPIPTPEQRLAAYKAKRLPKLHRRTLRAEAAKGSPEAIAKLKKLGADPGAGVAPGKGERFGTEKGTGKTRTPAKGALMGKKGQKLPEGVLPGGKHEVGKIDARAKHNKEAAIKRQEQTAANLKRSQELKKDQDAQGISSDSNFGKLKEKKY